MLSLDQRLYVVLGKIKEATTDAQAALLVDQQQSSPVGKRRVTLKINKVLNLSRVARGLSDKRAKR